MFCLLNEEKRENEIAAQFVSAFWHWKEHVCAATNTFSRENISNAQKGGKLGNHACVWEMEKVCRLYRLKGKVNGSFESKFRPKLIRGVSSGKMCWYELLKKNLLKRSFSLWAYEEILNLCIYNLWDLLLESLVFSLRNHCKNVDIKLKLSQTSKSLHSQTIKIFRRLNIYNWKSFRRFLLSCILKTLRRGDSSNYNSIVKWNQKYCGWEKAPTVVLHGQNTRKLFIIFGKGWMELFEKRFSFRKRIKYSWWNFW